jgi:hypothetical protein
VAEPLARRPPVAPLKGIGFDLLLVLGFAFDAQASEVAKEIPPKDLKPQDGFVAEWYDKERFFVRHAYFTGAGDPYEKLKRALRAEVDEAACASLYSTVSRPFDPPETGKIAVKVINDYGDEVLKVFEVPGAATSASVARTSA